jgi:neopullulanase
VVTEAVTLRFAGLPGARIELAGDFPCWRARHPLVETVPGEHRIDLLLPPGVYRYKFVADGERWLVDPAAPACERVEGVDNGVLVVGGTRPPLFFAPDSRHVGLFADGRLLLHLEVEADAAAPASVWLEVDGERLILPLTEVLVRGHRRLLRAAGAVPGEPRRLGFTAGPGFAPPPRRPAAATPPAWLAGATLYGIFVDRWHRAPGSPRDPRALSRQVPSTPSVFYGGDLDGIAGALDYLAGLGVDALVLTPVQCSASAHRYDGIDLAAVDPRLGGEAALRRLLAAAHARGLKVVVDVSLTHVSDRHPAFRDLLARQEESPYRDWFQVRRFPVRRGDPATFAHYYGCPDLPWLRLTPGPAREHAIGAALRLVDLGVDGLRLDAMEEAPAGVWAELRARARARKPDLLLLGEVVTDRLAAFAGEQGVDVATDFRDRETLVAFLATGAIDAREAYERLVFAAFRTGAFDPCLRLSFLDTHDTARFLSRAGSPRRLRLALALLLFLPSTVWLTYGTELDLAARQPEPPLDAAWPERLPMPALPPAPGETLEVLRQLCALRRELREDGAGPLALVAACGRLLVVERRGRSRRWRLALNAASEPGAAEDLPAPRLAIGCSATGPLPGESARLTWAAGPG